MKWMSATNGLRLIALSFVLQAFTVGAQTVRTNLLESMRTTCSLAMDRIAIDTQKQKDTALEQYGKRLDDQLKLLKQKGDIDTYALVAQESKRFESDKTIPTNSLHASLTNSVAAYQKRIQAIDIDSDHRMADLLRQYVAALGRLVKDLMARDKMVEAQEAGDVKRSAEVALADVELRLPRVEPQQELPPVPKLPASDRKPAPSDAAEYKGHHYKTFSDVSAWDAAQFRCRTRGGHLVTIEDGDENQFVYSLITANVGAWIGAESALGSWRWVSIAPFTYQNWATGEPDGKSTSDKTVSYRWKDGRRIEPSPTAKIGAGLKVAMYGDPEGFNDNRGHWFDQLGTEQKGVTAYVCEWDY